MSSLRTCNSRIFQFLDHRTFESSILLSLYEELEVNDLHWVKMRNEDQAVIIYIGVIKGVKEHFFEKS